MKIKQEIMEELFQGNIRIENVFHMQLITACDSLPDSFWEVFDSNHEGILHALKLQELDLSEYGELRAKQDVLEFLHDSRSLNGVLIHYATPVPRDLRFDNEGSLLGFSCGWGITTWGFVYGETLEEALSLLLQHYEKYLDECVLKARSERKGDRVE